MASWFHFDDTAANDGNDSLDDTIEPDGSGGYELILGGETHSEIRAVVEGNIKASADYGDDDEWDDAFQD